MRDDAKLIEAYERFLVEKRPSATVRLADQMAAVPARTLPGLAAQAKLLVFIMGTDDYGGADDAPDLAQRLAGRIRDAAVELCSRPHADGGTPSG